MQCYIFCLDYPKFKYSPEKNESNAINQLTADALYKRNKIQLNILTISCRNTTI